MEPKKDDAALEVTLETICGGAVPEMFEHELRNALANVLDPNTKATTKRVVTVTVTLMPGDERTDMRVVAEVKSKLAPVKGVGGTIYAGLRKGVPVATVYEHRQLQMQWDEEARPKSLEERRAAAGE